MVTFLGQAGISAAGECHHPLFCWGMSTVTKSACRYFNLACAFLALLFSSTIYLPEVQGIPQECMSLPNIPDIPGDEECWHTVFSREMSPISSKPIINDKIR